jgi:membrane protein YqaA with SNARE-associated domain
LEKPEPGRRRNERLKRIGALLVVVAISASVFVLGREMERFARFGYPGIFAFTLLSYASIILPGPGGAVVVIAGSVLNPFWVGLAAGAGASLGELSGYAAGYSGEYVLENVQLYQRLRTFMQASPWKTFFGLIALSAMPNPAFDLAGIAAGALRIPIPRFLGALLIGETIKMTLFALAGRYSIDWVMRLLER